MDKLTEKTVIKMTPGTSFVTSTGFLVRHLVDFRKAILQEAREKLEAKALAGYSEILASYMRREEVKLYVVDMDVVFDELLEDTDGYVA